MQSIILQFNHSHQELHTAHTLVEYSGYLIQSHMLRRAKIIHGILLKHKHHWSIEKEC
jgi:hypothetical protein